MALAGIAVALAAIPCSLLAGVSNVGQENVRVATGPRAERLRSVDSERYDYWVVAGEAFADAALGGLGSGGFGPEWLRERPPTRSSSATPTRSTSRPPPSWGWPASRAWPPCWSGRCWPPAARWRGTPRSRPGRPPRSSPVGVHAGLDWDFEMPALTLPALLLLALLSNAADEPQRGVSTR